MLLFLIGTVPGFILGAATVYLARLSCGLAGKEKEYFDSLTGGRAERTADSGGANDKHA